MAPITAELEAVLEKYKKEVQPAVAVAAPNGYGKNITVWRHRLMYHSRT
jgi:hypothetical protein